MLELETIDYLIGILFVVGYFCWGVGIYLLVKSCPVLSPIEMPKRNIDAARAREGGAG